MIDIKRQIESLRSIPLENIDEQFVLDLGLNDEILDEQPPEYSQYFGKGIKIWQYPVQFVPFLKKIGSVYVKSYMEIGVRYGGTFIVMTELLARVHPQLVSFACDIMPMSDILREYRKYRNFVYLQLDSKSEVFKAICSSNQIEFAFIDGDHFYEGVKNDYEIFKNKAETKHLVFHDIHSCACVDVGTVWREMKSSGQFQTSEYIEQYPSVPKNYLGIGYAARV